MLFLTGTKINKEASDKAFTKIDLDHFIQSSIQDSDNEEEIKEGDSRVVMRFHPALAPIKAAVLPLSKKLSDNAYKLYEQLCKKFPCEFDESGSIGKRYRRQDEIGTPFCITYDFESVEDQCVTVRDRDTMEQVRMPIADLVGYLKEKMEF